MELVRGSRLVERYKVVGCLGTGYHGPVFLAKDGACEDLTVALKVFHTWALRSKEAQSLMQEGYSAVQKMKGDCYVKPLAFVEHNGCEALALEYIEGSDLENLLSEGELTVREFLRILTLVAEKLVVSHQQDLIHNDLSPNQILVTAAGSVKLCGCPQPIGEQLNGEFPVNLRVGTAQYKSPEFLEDGISDPQNDIYSLGKITVSSLQRLQDKEDPLHQRLLEIGSKASAMLQEKRFESMDSFLAALEMAGEDLPRPLHGTLFVSLFASYLLGILAFFYFFAPELARFLQ